MRSSNAAPRLAVLLLSLVAAWSLPAGVIANGGFESGNTSPWTFVNGSAAIYPGTAWTAVAAAAHSGAYGARADGNWGIRQNFGGVPVSDIQNLSFWLQRPAANLGDVGQIQILMDFYYSDNTTGWFYTTINNNAWRQFDVTSSLNAAKTLTGIDTVGFLSCAGHATLAGCVPLGPFTTYVDDFTLIRKSDPAPVPEPATFWLSGGAVALWLGRRRIV